MRHDAIPDAAGSHDRELVSSKNALIFRSKSDPYDISSPFLEPERTVAPSLSSKPSQANHRATDGDGV